MRIKVLATSMVALGLCSLQAWGGEASTLKLRRPATTRTTTYEYADYYGEDGAESPSDNPPAAAPDGATEDADEATEGKGSCSKSCDSCGNGCCHNDCCCDDGCCLFPCHELGDPCKLFDCCCLEQHKITMGGWIAQGYTINPDHPADGYNGPQTFNDRANEYQLNQAWWYGERATDTGGCGWDFGGRFDVLYGTDYRWTTARGLEVETDFGDKWNGGQRFYGLALPQLYAEVAVNDWKVKLGHFFTPIGYEVVNATGNFFYSHVYTHQYGEPFTHTGVLATKTVNDQLTVSGGFNRGWDAWSDNNEDLSVLGGFAWTSADKFASLAWYFNVGDEDDAGRQNRYVQSIVLTLQLQEDLKYVAHSDYGSQQGAGWNPGEDAEWYSITQYLMYTINDCWSAGFRYEFFADDDGFRVSQILPDDSHTIPLPGVPAHWQDITFGFNYKPHANFVVRPEVRWDWVEPLVNVPASGPGSGPYDDRTDRSQFTAACDVIMTF